VTVTTNPTTPDAQALLNGFFDNFGLSSLASWAWGLWQQGWSIDSIVAEMRTRPEYQARFPAMAALAKAGQAITEQQYIDYERTIGQLNQAAGLPAGMYDTRDDIAKLLINNVSPTEYKSRLDDYTAAVYQAPPEVRNILQQFYGVTDGQMAAFFMDPDKALPLIQKEYTAAQAGGAAQYTGYGQITQQQAESLAALGVSQSQLQSGFSNLANIRQVLNGLPGQNQPGITTDQALAAQFQGNAEDQQLIENRQNELVNQFKQGGQVATTSKGAVGAGVAQ
jgi:hypothetical protein